MKNPHFKHIVQLLPGDGWYARFADESYGEETERVVCFALIEGASGTTAIQPVVSMFGDLEFAAASKDYKGLTRTPADDEDEPSEVSA